MRVAAHRQLGALYPRRCGAALTWVKDLFQMEPEVVRLIADLSVDFSDGHDVGGRAR
jgi:hypothetical protein